MSQQQEEMELAPAAPRENLKGAVPSLASDDEVRTALEKAFDYRGDVTIEPDGTGGSVIHWRSTFDTKAPGTGWLWRSGFRRLLRRTVSDLVAAAESPRG